MQNRSPEDKGVEILSLIHATEEGDVDTVSEILAKDPALAAAMLISHGADINLKDDCYNDTPLGWANESRQLEMVDFLISSGAAISIGDAARTGKSGLVKAFIEFDSALVELGTNNGWTPLYSSSGWGHLDVVRILLECGADVNALSLHGNTALHAAISEGNGELATLLLQNGAMPNPQTTDGTTPLHRAAWYRRAEMVTLLVENGGDPAMKESNGLTSLDLALAEEGSEVTNWGQANAVDRGIVKTLRGE